MTLRGIHEFALHIQSFRNIDLWYQGGYMLKTRIFIEKTSQNKTQYIYAHPFAHTEHAQASQQYSFVQSQVFKQSFIDNTTSSFISKSFLMRYYQQQVQLNDICHFRVETDLAVTQPEFILEVTLIFFDNVKKSVDPAEIVPEKGKVSKTNRYKITKSKGGMHQFICASFDGQYFSVVNVALHSVCIDYRYRSCPIQLFEFSRMTGSQKRQLLDKNTKYQGKQINYWDRLCKQLKVSADLSSIQLIQQLTLDDMKNNYAQLLKQYSILFSQTIHQHHKNHFSALLVHPNQLPLFQHESFFNKKGSQGWNNLRTDNLAIIVQKILNQTNLVSGELLKLWHHFIDLIKISPRFAIAHYQNKKNQIQTQFWNKLTARIKYKVSDVCMAPKNRDQYHDNSQKNLEEARNKIGFDSHIINQQLFSKKNIFPLMIQETYESISSQRKKTIESEEQSMLSLHLIVFVHGFQGNSMDMKLIKNHVSLLYPQASFLCATSNQQMTDNDIVELGNRLATQIKTHIMQSFPSSSLQRISFVGHSLGGIIIRAALPKLLDLKNKFYCFMSFSSPHLGYKVNTSSVIEAGIWVLQKFKNSHCLSQLTLTDSSNPRESCLYKISNFQGMSYFKQIFLFSSKQDSYAPYQSARIEIHPDFMNTKDHLKQIHCEMVRNILKGIQPQRLHRIGVNFTIEGTSLDTIIGRTAHILFLENSHLLQLFLRTHPGLFQ